MAESDRYSYSREATDDTLSSSAVHPEDKGDDEDDDAGKAGTSDEPESPKPEFDPLAGTPFESPKDLTDDMINDLFKMSDVSDFGIAIQCKPRPLVINCSPKYKKGSKEALLNFHKRYRVLMVIIWQELRIVGAVTLDQKFKMTKRDFGEPPPEGGSALGLPVTVTSLPGCLQGCEVDGQRGLLSMYHCLAAQIEQGEDEELMDHKIELPPGQHFEASHEGEFHRIGTRARGAVARHERGQASGEVSVTFIDDPQLKVIAPPPSLGLPSAPVQMAEMDDIWDLGIVWKNGPVTNETKGEVVYVRQCFSTRTEHMGTVQLTDAVVAKNEVFDVCFALRGDSGSVVYSRNKDSTHKLLGAVSSVIQYPNDESSQAATSGGASTGGQWVWVYQNKRDHGVYSTSTYAASNQVDGDLVKTKGITFILPYVNQIKVARRKLQLDVVIGHQ